MINHAINNFIKRIPHFMALFVHRISLRFLEYAVLWGRRLSKKRMQKGKLRSLWGVTPILTLPLLARCDRLLGINSQSFVYVTYVVTQKFDINLNRPRNWLLKNAPAFYTSFINIVMGLALLRYDIFHFFCDRGIMDPVNQIGIHPKELALLKRAGKFLFTYTYGADIRTQKTTQQLGKYHLCMSCPAPLVSCICDDNEGRTNISRIRESATAMISMGDMVAYVPGAYHIHYWPIDINRLAYIGVRQNWGKPLRIAHVPNHPHFKGTSYLEAVVQRLSEEDFAIELLRAEGVTNDRVLEIYSEADIVADQFIAGFHGYAALEAMSLGKPVLCFLRNDDMMLDPNTCPIINTNPDTLYDVLKRILLGDLDLVEIGKRGRQYIENHYSLPAVATRLGKMYLELINPSIRVQKNLSNKLLRMHKS